MTIKRIFIAGMIKNGSGINRPAELVPEIQIWQFTDNPDEPMEMKVAVLTRRSAHNYSISKTELTLSGSMICAAEHVLIPDKNFPSVRHVKIGLKPGCELSRLLIEKGGTKEEIFIEGYVAIEGNYLRIIQRRPEPHRLTSYQITLSSNFGQAALSPL